MLIYFAVFSQYKVQNNFSYYVTQYIINILKKNNLSVLLSSFRKKKSIIKISSMFFSHLYLTIYFLCQKTHTLVPFLFLFLGSKLESVKLQK